MATLHTRKMELAATDVCAVKQIIRQAMDACSGAPVLLAKTGPFYIVLKCTNTCDCSTLATQCTHVRHETIGCELEVWQAGDSAAVSEERTSAAVKSLNDLVETALAELKAEFKGAGRRA